MGEEFGFKWFLPTENPNYVDDVIRLSKDFEIISNSDKES